MDYFQTHRMNYTNEKYIFRASKTVGVRTMLSFVAQAGQCDFVCNECKNAKACQQLEYNRFKDTIQFQLAHLQTNLQSKLTTWKLWGPKKNI